MIDVRAEIEKRANPKNEAFLRKLVPNLGNAYGVKTSDIRIIAKMIIKDDWRSFLKTESYCIEHKSLKGLVINNASMSPDERMTYIREFVPNIDNWAVCDMFCTKRKMNPEEKTMLWNYCLEQFDSDSEFGMRFAAVMTMCNYLDDDHVDRILELVSSKKHDGYYYKMAVAWCLSFCYIKYPEKTEPFIFGLEKDVMTMAVRKICDSYRVDADDKERLKIKRKAMLRI